MGLLGDMRYMGAVTLTGDVRVAHFTDEPDVAIAFQGPKGESLRTNPDFIATLVGAGTRWVSTIARREQKIVVTARIDALNVAAQQAGAVHEVIYRKDVNDIFFDNWAMLSARMNCADPDRFDCGFEQGILSAALRSGKSVTLETLLSVKGVDSARMLSSLGFALMKGVAKTNLTTALLSLASEISHN
jgi:hypothetical protein